MIKNNALINEARAFENDAITELTRQLQTTRGDLKENIRAGNAKDDVIKQLKQGKKKSSWTLSKLHKIEKKLYFATLMRFYIFVRF